MTACALALASWALARSCALRARAPRPLHNAELDARQAPAAPSARREAEALRHRRRAAAAAAAAAAATAKLRQPRARAAAAHRAARAAAREGAVLALQQPGQVELEPARGEEGAGCAKR